MIASDTFVTERKVLHCTNFNHDPSKFDLKIFSISSFHVIWSELMVFQITLILHVFYINFYTVHVPLARQNYFKNLRYLQVAPSPLLDQQPYPMQLIRMNLVLLLILVYLIFS